MPTTTVFVMKKEEDDSAKAEPKKSRLDAVVAVAVLTVIAFILAFGIFLTSWFE